MCRRRWAKGESGGPDGGCPAQLHRLPPAQDTETSGVWVDSTAFPPTLPPFLTTWQCYAQDTGWHPCPSLRLCARLVLPPLPGLPSLPFLLENFYPSFKTRLQYFSLKPRLIVSSSRGLHRSYLPNTEALWAHTLIQDFIHRHFPCCYDEHASEMKPASHHY